MTQIRLSLLGIVNGNVCFPGDSMTAPTAIFAGVICMKTTRVWSGGLITAGLDMHTA